MQSVDDKDGEVLAFLGVLVTARVEASIILATSVLAAVLVWSFTPPKYRAETLFFVRGSDAGPSLSGPMASAAALAGISLDGSNERARRAKALLRSRRFALEFIRINALDSEMGVNAGCSWCIGSQDEAAPDWKLAERWLTDVIDLAEDDASGSLTLRVVWTDPKEAASIAREYLRAADDLLRADALARTTENLEYLRGQLVENRLVEVRASIAGLIESELSQQMLAQSAGPYTFDVIDPAIEVAEPTSPSPMSLLFAFIALGLILFVNYALLRTYYENSVKRSNG